MTGLGTVAALLAGSAVWLLLWRPRVPAGASRAGKAPRLRWRWVPVVGRVRRRGSALRDAAQVSDACDLLAAELAAGRPPGAALDLAARQWPPLAPVAEAFALGADVPAALRRVSCDRPGAGDLRLVAAAWQVSHRSGQGLAAALHRVASGIHRRQRTRRLVASELASARATARLVAVLPVVALGMGSGAGGDPWRFLVATPLGWVCLLAGGGLLVLGLAWIEALADRAAPP